MLSVPVVGHTGRAGRKVNGSLKPYVLICVGHDLTRGFTWGVQKGALGTDGLTNDSLGWKD